MNKSESIAELAKALAAFQGDVKQPLKDKANPFFKSKYVPLENVVEAVTETASKHGLSFIQYPLNQDNKVGIITILMHESGQWIETEPIFATPAKQDPQGVGSTITYLKRYSLSAVFGITSDEDDDANTATYPNGYNNQGFQQQQYRQAPPQQQQPNGMASPNQVKAMMAKAKNVAVAQGLEGTNDDLHNVYIQALNECKIPNTLKSNQLTKQQASKVIEALAAKEPQTAQ